MNNCLIFTLNEKIEVPLRPLKGYVVTLTEAKNYTFYGGIVNPPSTTFRRIYGDAMFYTDNTFSTIDGDGKTQSIKQGNYYVKVNKAPCQIVVQDDYLLRKIECADTRLIKCRPISAISYITDVEPLHLDSSDLQYFNSIKEIYLQGLTIADKIIRFDIRDFGKCVELFALQVPAGAYGEIEELLQAMYDNGRLSGTLNIYGLNVSAGRTNITYQGTKITAAMKFQFSDAGWSIL